MHMDSKLVKCILLKSIEQCRDGKVLDPWTHGIPYDIYTIKHCCEELQVKGYLIRLCIRMLDYCAALA